MLSGDVSQKSKVISAAQKQDGGISNTPAAVYVEGNGQLILIFLCLPLKPEVNVQCTLGQKKGEGMMTMGRRGRKEWMVGGEGKAEELWHDEGKNKIIKEEKGEQRKGLRLLLLRCHIGITC